MSTKRVLFDADCLTAAQDAIRRALEPLGKRVKLGFVVGKPMTKAGRFVCDISAAPLALKQKPEQTHWNLKCREFGFQEADWGKVFMCQSKKFKLWNVNPNHPKPIVTRCRKIKNQLFHFTPDYVQKALTQCSQTNSECNACKTRWSWSTRVRADQAVVADKFDPSKLFHRQPDTTWLCNACDLERVRASVS